MSRPRVAIVSRDPDLRLQAARAFDRAPAGWLVALFETAPDDADVVVHTPDVPGEGIELDLKHPHKTLARIKGELSSRAPGAIIDVATTGGGTGGSSVALHLASYLGRTAPAVYVESDRSCGGRLRLALEEKGPSWADAGDAESLILTALPLPSGFRAVFAPPSDADLPAEVVAWCVEAFRFVVIDRGPRCFGSTDPSSGILVMPPSVPSARRAADILAESTPADWTIVTNRLGPGSEATDTALETILEGRRIALALPCSPSLRDAEDTGRLLGPHATAWSRRVAKLAQALART